MQNKNQKWLTVSAWSKQDPSKHTHMHGCNEITLVWGSLRLTPIMPGARPASHPIHPISSRSFNPLFERYISCSLVSPYTLDNRAVICAVISKWLLHLLWFIIPYIKISHVRKSWPQRCSWNHCQCYLPVQLVNCENILLLAVKTLEILRFHMWDFQPSWCHFRQCPWDLGSAPVEKG